MSLPSFSIPSLKTLKKSKSEKLKYISEQNFEIINIKQIGNYKLGQEIGSGAFGKVILAKHIPTEEKVAIKILNKSILNQTPADYQLVKKELSILKIVKHKNIVRLYEILETPRHIFIVMEYCEGGDIMNYILNRKRLTEFESLKYFHQLINALYYLHSQNIAHRDIKIDNLLLDSNFDLKLIDFGLSTKYKDDELLNQPCGTIVYAAPEVLNYQDYHGMLADVWSCGIVLYGMLSGFLPFGDSDDEINKKKILEGRIKMPSYFSEGAKNLLRHMLDVNPLTRYTLEDIMQHPWFNKKKFKIIPGIIVGINWIPVDEKILDLCVSYNLDRDKVKNSIIYNKFNAESAIYYLLVQKMKKMGNDSVSDLCSKKYIDYMLDEGNDILNYNITTENNDFNWEKNNYSNNSKIEHINDLKRFNNFVHSDNDMAKYLNTNFQRDNKKFINIENNFKNNIIIFDDRKERNEISRNNATQRINLPEKLFKTNYLDFAEEHDFYNEIIDKNTIETDRLINKGKLIVGKKLDLIQNKKEKIKKKIINIRSKNFPLDKFLNKKHFKTIEIDNKNNLNKEFIKNVKAINKMNIINKNNNRNYLALKSLELNENNLNFNSTFNTKNNINHVHKKNIGEISQKKGEYFKVTKNKDIKIQNANKNENLNNTHMLSKDNNRSYFKKSKITNPVINIPLLNITNKINLNEPYKKIVKKKKIDLNMNGNNTNNNDTNRTFKNKSEEKRKIINTQRNNVSTYKKILINILKKKSNIPTINLKKEKNLKKEPLQIKKITNYTEREKYILNVSSNNDIKLNKSGIMNLIDNFNLKNQNSILNKNKDINNTIINNKIKNNFYFNNKIPLGQNDNISNGNNTNRISTKRIIYNLKDNNLKSLNFNFKNKIKKLNLKNIDILNKSKANQNRINKGNKIILTNIKKNNQILSRNQNNLNHFNEINIFDNNEKCNTSRISVKLRNKKIAKINLNKNILNSQLNNISESSLFNNILTKQEKTIFMQDKKKFKINSFSRLGIDPILKSNKISNMNKLRNTNAESSVGVFRKKSPFQIRDLSDSPKQKYLNEKTRKNRIPWKIKRKGIDDKLDPINIYDKYIKKIKMDKNNPFKNKNYLKNFDVNSHQVKFNKNKLFEKNNNKNINPKLFIKNELNTYLNNFNNSSILSENNLNNINQINNLKLSNKRDLININKKVVNSYQDKKNVKEKFIKYRNINLPIESKKKINSKYNNETYLTLNNYNKKNFI